MSNEYINSKIEIKYECKVEENFKESIIYPYIKKEDNEIIFFLLKNKITEICFTNKALVHMFLDSSSDKFIINRYEFYRNKILNVSLDFNFSKNLSTLSFEINKHNFLISLDSNSNAPIVLYKTLSTLEEEFIQNDIILQTANKSLLVATELLSNTSSNNISDDFKNITKYSYDWITKFRNKYTLFDISEIYKKYL